MAHVFWRHRIIRLGHFHMPIAMNDALASWKKENRSRGNGNNAVFFDLEKLPDLLLRRAMNAQIGDMAFPVRRCSFSARSVGKVRPFSPLRATLLSTFRCGRWRSDFGG